MPSHQSITPGAQRSLDRAAQLATAAGSRRIETGHMLWALWQEEGNAAALLESLGVKKETIELSESPANPSQPGHMDEMAEDILYEARQFARRFCGHSAELTSEHLLLALTATDEVFLSDLGVTVEAIVAIAFPQPDTSALPVSPEFRLGDDEPTEESPKAEDKPTQDPIQLARPTGFNEPTQIFRAIDAAANRTREGLRVVEDYTRFVLDDRFLTEELKTCRHELAGALSTVSNASLVRCRDTRGDVGTTVTTTREYSRDSMQDVVLANMKRVQEGLRTLEEFLKVEETGAACSAKIESIRYRSYTIEKAIAATMNSNDVLRGRSLYLLVTESLCRLAWKEVVIQALEGGVSVVQLREKHLRDEEVVERGRWIRKATRDAGALFVMNDRPDLAVETDADGIHVGQTEMAVSDVRKTVGPKMLIGVSTHEVRQARKAVFDGADYLGVGPVFETETKSFQNYAGPDYVSGLRSQTSLPWFAIGGINSTNVSQAVAAGASRIAVSGAICGSDRPREAAETLLEALVL